jgi:hypothetical protein
MSNTPYLPGRLFINYSQVGELMKLYDGWSSDFDPNRQVKVLYSHPDYPEPMPLHTAFYNFAKKMIDKAKTSGSKLGDAL